MNIAICDDEKYMIDKVWHYVKLTLDSNQMNYTCDFFTDSSSLIAANSIKPFDVIFLDILIPEISGFEAAAMIRKHSPKSYIIFITSNEESVYDSFEYQPFQFIRKDKDEILSNRIIHVVESLLTHLKQNRVITLDLSFSENKNLPISDIIAVKSERNYIEYYLYNSEIVRTRGKIIDTEKELADMDFVRIHNRWLINMRHIISIDYPNNEVHLSNAEIAPLSRNKKAMLQEKYLKYLRTKI